MKSWSPTLEFNDERSLYQIVFNYIQRNDIEISGKRKDEISRKIVRELIFKKGAFVNSKFITHDTVKIKNGDRIQMLALGIDFKCVKNLTLKLSEDLPKPPKSVSRAPLIVANEPTTNVAPIPVPVVEEKVSENIDKFILDYLNTFLDCKTIEEIKTIDTKKAFSHIVHLFQLKGFEAIRKSEFSYDLTDFIKSKIINSSIAKELNILKSQLNTASKLIEILIHHKMGAENGLRLFNENLSAGYYDKSLFKYLENYRKLYYTGSFQYLINPFLNNNVASQLAIESLLKPVNKSLTVEGIEAKYLHYEESKPTFDSYFELLKSCDDYNNNFFFPVAEYLFKLLKINCNTAIEKSAQIKVQATNRKYNFSNTDRIEQELFLNISNDGEGLAKSVSISSLTNEFQFTPIKLGILKPRERREVSVLAAIRFDSGFNPFMSVQFQWEEVSGKQSNSTSKIEFKIQQTEIPWEDLKKQNPYSFSIIDSPEKLFGRNEIISELVATIQSDNIESYKLWGQKRVGKSSIVKTLKAILDSAEKSIVIYRPLGGLRNTEPINTLNSLGKSLCTEIYEEIDRKIQDPAIRERLRMIPSPTFDGSLLPLEDYLKQLRRIDNSLKFIFILDEFDRINEEFFLPGNLGETLSLAIGKGLNENRFIGFILVGSENMHLLDRHGINYNSYRQKEVDTFNKQWEYESFVQIVKGPVAPYINFSDEAIDRIFLESNGNPYFANLICAEIFKTAYKLKDTEIDAHIVNDAVSIIVNSSNKSHFEHYWSDGITEESSIMKERKADIRRRILVSFSMASTASSNVFPTKNEIERRFKPPLETEYEIEKYEVGNTITEFVNRKIFVESNFNQIRILPHLFESWLCGKGKSLMIEGVSDLLALQREVDLERELALKTDELDRLSEKYRFHERKIATQKYTEYFNQFGSASDQRRVFKLIDAIYFISKDDLLDFYRKENRNIFTKTEIFLKEKAKTIFREDIELYTFSKYFSENVPIVESFKKLNHIRQQKHLKPIKDDCLAWKRNGSDEILIIEPIIENYSDIQEELFLLLNDEVKNAPVSIRIISFVITTKAKADLITATSSFTNLKLVIFKEMEETQIKPFIQGTEIFENSDESNQAYYEVRKHFPTTSKDVLLVLFEDLCPSKSCPVLWFKSAQFHPLFHNEFGTLETLDQVNEGEKRRDKLYFSVKELEQSINRYITSYLTKRAESEAEKDWFILKYIPRKTYDNINRKWLDEEQRDPKESYFDFIDYKEIVLYSKDDALKKIFSVDNRYEWMDKCNVLRRDHAHPVKPAPLEEEVDYFEKIKNLILPRLS
jgi:hypothetical protein